MIPLRLKESCILYSGVTRNRYGDFGLNAGTAVACLYRDISQLNENVNFREEQRIVGILWIDPAVNVSQGDIVKYNGLLYRIETLTKAKTLLTHDTLHFFKCLVSLYRAVS